MQLTGRTLPPGNSHMPANVCISVRLANRTCPRSLSKATATTTSIFVPACVPNDCKTPRSLLPTMSCKLRSPTKGADCVTCGNADPYTVMSAIGIYSQKHEITGPLTSE